MNRSSRFFALLLLCLACEPVAAQQAPLKGVVWQEPMDVQAALRDLMVMDSLGIQAVRTGIIRHEPVLTLADTLGLHVFQELPVAYVPTSGLEDTLGFATRMLDVVLARSRRHPSARHIGLARMSDTSDPAACGYFEQLTRRLRSRGAAGSRSYYVTPFAEQDACAGAVDLVLVNALDAEHPADLLQKWRAGSDTSTAVGIGALGTWAGGERLGRTWKQRTAATQARYLETRLNRLLHGPLPVRPYAIFVYRWEDESSGDLRGLGGMNPRYQTYGLTKEDGTRRPAFDVVRGIYSGDQLVFALNVASSSSSTWPWKVLLGWGAIALLGGFYAASPRLRFMIPRYFSAHGFYRDAVREGRDVLVASSAALLGVLAVTTGLVATIFLEQASAEPGFAIFLRWLAEPARAFIITLVEQPWVAFLLLGCLYALGTIFWSGLLALISRRRYVLAPSQTLMLVVWPRWPLLMLLLAAMVIPSLPHDAALKAAGIALAVLVIVTLLTVFRTVYDFASVTRVSFPFVLLAWIVSPMVLLIVAVLLMLLPQIPEATFLYHLVVYR